MDRPKEEFRKSKHPPNKSEEHANVDETAEQCSLVERAIARLVALSKEHVFTAECCFHIIELIKIKPSLAPDILNADKNVFKCFDFFNRIIQKHAANLLTPKTSKTEQQDSLADELYKITLTKTCEPTNETPNVEQEVVEKKSNKILCDLTKTNEQFLAQWNTILNHLRNNYTAIVLCELNFKKELSSKQKKTLENTKEVIVGLGECIKISIKNFPSCLESKNSKKRRSIPSTTRKDKYLDKEKKKYVEMIMFSTTQRLEPDEEDDLLSFYCFKTVCFEIDRTLRLYLWAADEQNQAKLKILSSELNNFRAIHKFSTAAYEKLMSLSLLLAYLDPSYNKNDGPYAEEHIMELIVLDQFPEANKTSDQIREIAKLKDKEKNRRIRNQEDDYQAITKAFSFIDIRVAKMVDNYIETLLDSEFQRTSHKMAEFYFYLIRYVKNKWEDVEDLYLVFRDVCYQMMSDVEKIAAKNYKKAEPEESKL